MAYTAYRVLKAPIDQIERFMTEAIADGWQPLGAPILLYPDDKAVYQALVKGTPDGSGTGPVTIVVEDIADASVIGKSLLTAVNEEDGRAAIGPALLICSWALPQPPPKRETMRLPGGM
ncbi:DUF1737 domain-containing protein [Pseudomonas aeruginosa]|nr:DUF1737 domain-containing protein [Pseudomonas aeruginosa]EKW4410222.1 DUF1737 domain-containing protein [Pseudomonas aeruginosa]WPE43936.1 DUF1737 domain-containing protein [Pseudomonas aeruginosa]